MIFFSVLPTKDYDTFLTFPYKDSAERIYNATNGLTILNQSFSKFCNKGKEELRGMEFANMNTTESKKVYFLYCKDHLWML